MSSFFKVNDIIAVKVKPNELMLSKVINQPHWDVDNQYWGLSFMDLEDVLENKKPENIKITSDMNINLCYKLKSIKDVPIKDDEIVYSLYYNKIEYTNEKFNHQLSQPTTIYYQGYVEKKRTNCIVIDFGRYTQKIPYDAILDNKVTVPSVIKKYKQPKINNNYWECNQCQMYNHHTNALCKFC